MMLRNLAAGLALIACLALPGPPLFADAYPRQPAIDVQHYRFCVTLGGPAGQIAGETTVTVRFVQDGVTEFALDLAAGMAVSEVTSSGAPARFTHRSGRLTIALPAAPKAGESRQVTVKYHGIPAGGLNRVRNRW